MLINWNSIHRTFHCSDSRQTIFTRAAGSTIKFVSAQIYAFHISDRHEMHQYDNIEFFEFSVSARLSAQ